MQCDLRACHLCDFDPMYFAPDDDDDDANFRIPKYLHALKKKNYIQFHPPQMIAALSCHLPRILHHVADWSFNPVPK